MASTLVLRRFDLIGGWTEAPQEEGIVTMSSAVVEHAPVPEHPSPGGREKRGLREFLITQEGSDVDAAYTVAREHDLWNDKEALGLKKAFIIANRPKGVAADHYLDWVTSYIQDPMSDKVPQQHLEAVARDAAVYGDPDAPALAIDCSWAESTDHLSEIGRTIGRGRRRPGVYRFVGTVRTR